MNLFNSQFRPPPYRHYRHLNAAVLTVSSRSQSTVVNLAHLTSPIDVAHLASVGSNSELLASYNVTPPIRPWPSRLTPGRLASMIRRAADADLALRIFHHAAHFHRGFSPNYASYHAIIDRLARARAFDLLPPLLSSLRRSGIRCGEDAFISQIRAFSLSSRPADSFRVFLSIPSFRVQRSVRSFNALLNAMVQNRRLRLVPSLFYSCHTKFGIIPNVCSCNILLKALCGVGDLTGARKVLDEMPAMGIVPNTVSYTTLIAGHCALGDLDGAKALFAEIIDHGFTPDTTAYTVLIDGYCRRGLIVEAARLMDEMESSGVVPNAVTYAVLIDACCKLRKTGEALNLMSSMLDAKHVPSSTLCCKVIDALCEDGKVEGACLTWKKLLKNNVTPDNSISSTLIYWLCKKGMIMEAKKLFNEFERGFIPSLLTYNTLISGMCENGELQEAGRLWDDMVERRCAPNAFTYNVLINGFCGAGKPNEGIRILEEMFESTCTPNKFTYEVLIDGLQKSGDMEEIDKLILIAVSKRRFLDVESWSIFVSKMLSDSNEWRETLNVLLET
ncbi:Pentatricopeptide repeat-containing protein [Platanthera zijinensis]|uniref:Pentatricopeptide repeat-containing protein n=1 Tax=Platanthera zijinensis TaxID=2320716 RepID=A0AAP0BWS7_9ASPA